VPSRRDAWLDALARALPRHPIVDRVEHARYALIWKQPHGTLAHAHALAAVFVLGAGVDHSLADASLPAGVPIVRLRDAGMAAQMVDYCIYAALHFQREFDAYLVDQAARRWQPRPARARLRVGVLGLGELGAAVARALAGLGFVVEGWARRARTLAGVEVRVGDAGLHALLSTSDLVIGVLPHTPATAGLLDRSRLELLPRGAALINVGRGSLLDEQALLELLDAGHLRGAFLDVCAREPLPVEHPLWSHPAVRLTPHVAAETLIEPAVAQIADDIARLEAGLAVELVAR
jgi:glyoxylate/hydroxypyruvate reductase A